MRRSEEDNIQIQSKIKEIERILDGKQGDEDVCDEEMKRILNEVKNLKPDLDRL